MSALDTAPALTDPAEQRIDELIDQLLREHDPKTTPAVEFLGAQYDLGLAWVHFPEGFGGLGMSPKLQRIVNGRIAHEGGTVGGMKTPIGSGMCGPAVVVHGTDEQRAMLRPLFTNEHVWCQLFS